MAIHGVVAGADRNAAPREVAAVLTEQELDGLVLDRLRGQVALALLVERAAKALPGLVGVRVVDGHVGVGRRLGDVPVFQKAPFPGVTSALTGGVVPPVPPEPVVAPPLPVLPPDELPPLPEPVSPPLPEPLSPPVPDPLFPIDVAYWAHSAPPAGPRGEHRPG